MPASPASHRPGFLQTAPVTSRFGAKQPQSGHELPPTFVELQQPPSQSVGPPKSRAEQPAILETAGPVSSTIVSPTPEVAAAQTAPAGPDPTVSDRIEEPTETGPPLRRSIRDGSSSSSSSSLSGSGSGTQDHTAALNPATEGRTVTPNATQCPNCEHRPQPLSYEVPPYASTALSQPITLQPEHHPEREVAQPSSTLDVYTATRAYGSRTASSERYIIKKSGISVADWFPPVRSTQGCFVTMLLGADHGLRCINILESVGYCWEIKGVHYWWKRKTATVSDVGETGHCTEKDRTRR